MFLNRTSKFFFVIAIAISLSACGSNEADLGQKKVLDSNDKTVKTENAKMQKFETSTYVVNYPLDWEEGDSGQEGIEFIALSPAESKDDNFMENVNLVIDDAHSEYSATEYMDSSVEYLQSYLPDMKILENNLYTSKNGIVFNKVVYTAVMNGQKANDILETNDEELNQIGDNSLTWAQYIAKDNGVFYIITFTSQEDSYKKYEDTFKNIIDNFELKEL